MKMIRLIALCLLLPMAALAQAPPPADGPAKMPFPGGHGMMHGGPMGKWWKDSDVVKKLNLSDAQVAQLDKLVSDQHEQLMALGQNMEAESTKLKGLLNTEHLDDGLINAQVEQVMIARGKMERQFTQLLLDTRKVLTIDQWRQLEAMLPTRVRDHMKHFQPGGPGPDAPPPPPDGF